MFHSNQCYAATLTNTCTVFGDSLRDAADAAPSALGRSRFKGVPQCAASARMRARMPQGRQQWRRAVGAHHVHARDDRRGAGRGGSRGLAGQGMRMGSVDPTAIEHRRVRP